jgi:hypothetical protein
MLIQKTLRVGDGLYSTLASRRGERLFGETATGRSKLGRVDWSDYSSSGPTIYDPTKDNCVDAYVRLLAARALKHEGFGCGGRPLTV